MDAILFVLPIVVMVIIGFWHSRKFRMFKAELFEIYDAKGVPRPETGDYELNCWKNFYILPSDNEEVRFAKHKLLAKVWAYSIKTIIVSFACFFGSTLVAMILRRLL
jgi:hypothetical protein